MNNSQIREITASIIGKLSAAIIMALIISVIIYFFKRRDAETNEEKKELFLSIFVRIISIFIRIAILVFISACLANLVHLIDH